MFQDSQFSYKLFNSGLLRLLNKGIRIFVILIYLLYSLGLPTMSVYAQPYSLNVTFSPEIGGSVTISPDLDTYDAGAVVTLTPAPETGYSFSGWSGTNAAELVDLENGSWTISMNGNKELTANFIDVTSVQQNTTLTGSALSAFFSDISRYHSSRIWGLRI